MRGSDGVRVQRGDVWLVDLEPTVGNEQGGRRPVIVVSSDGYNRRRVRVVVVVPITRTDRGYPTHLPLPAGSGGLDYRSFAMTEQIRVASVERFGRWLGRMDRETMDRVSALLIAVLDLWPDD